MRYTFLYSILLSILIASCQSSDKGSSYPSAGTLQYKIAYPKSISESPTISILPQELNLSFHNNKIRNEIKGGFSLFSLNFYSPSPDDSCYVTFNFMSRVLSYSMDKRNCMFLYDQEEAENIIYFENETKIIAGFNCNKALAQFKNQEPFIIYYTQEIKLKQANRHTPFKEVPGVLMQFPVVYKGMKLTITADTFSAKKPAASTFKLPRESSHSTKNEIDSIVTTLLNNFK